MAAAATAVLPFISRPTLELALRGLNSLSAGAVVDSFFAALALFAIPITLLGMVLPFAIRLAIRDIKAAGETAERLYALSIVGTFVSAIIAIPLIGTQRTMLGSAALLALSAALLLGSGWQLVTILFVALLAIPVGEIKASEGLIYETGSSQQYIQVTKQTNGARALRLNDGVASHSIWREDTVFTGGVWDMFLMIPPLLTQPPETMLVIGNSGGTVARAYGVLYPGIEIDGVETDPEVTEVGKRYLGLGDNPNLDVITTDGRPHLRLTNKRYDIIIVDAYKQPYIPFSLATREFFELTRERLTDNGFLALNVAAVPDDNRLSRTISSTVLAEPPQAWQWKPLRFNELLLAYNDTDLTRNDLVGRAAGVHPDASVLGELLARDTPTIELFAKGCH